MGKFLVQIYEVQTPAEAEKLVEMGVDHIGSVLFAGADPRGSALREVVDATRKAGAKTSLIPLFQDADRISRALDWYQPDIVHFCETLVTDRGTRPAWEQPFSLQRGIKERFPEIKAMRSIPIGITGLSGAVPSLSLASRFEEISDYFLTDTLLVNLNCNLENEQPVSGFVGITGLTCDWDVAAALVRQSSIPVILAGGISPENAAHGITHVCPAGIDSCTCTNAVDENGHSIRFKKDLFKVRKLVNAVRRFEK